jgi:hypothetical protein
VTDGTARAVVQAAVAAHTLLPAGGIRGHWAMPAYTVAVEILVRTGFVSVGLLGPGHFPAHLVAHLHIAYIESLLPSTCTHMTSPARRTHPARCQKLGPRGMFEPDEVLPAFEYVPPMLSGTGGVLGGLLGGGISVSAITREELAAVNGGVVPDTCAACGTLAVPGFWSLSKCGGACGGTVCYCSRK